MVALRPAPAVLRAQLTLGRDLLARSLAFQACFLSAAAVATRFGAATAAAHQIVLQLWFFQALVLDAVAIAAQSLVGAALGSPDRGAQRARALARQVTRYGLVLGIAFGVLFAALAGVLPPVFTPDPTVLAAVPVAWWFFAALQPVAGVVFALDGVLLGAGDAAFLRTSTLVAAVVGFLPLIWAVAGVRLGPGRHLVRTRGVHADPPRRRGAAGPQRSLGRDGRGSLLSVAWPRGVTCGRQGTAICHPCGRRSGCT